MPISVRFWDFLEQSQPKSPLKPHFHVSMQAEEIFQLGGPQTLPSGEGGLDGGLFPMFSRMATQWTPWRCLSKGLLRDCTICCATISWGVRTWFPPPPKAILTGSLCSSKFLKKKNIHLAQKNLGGFFIISFRRQMDGCFARFSPVNLLLKTPKQVLGREGYAAARCNFWGEKFQTVERRTQLFRFCWQLPHVAGDRA